LATPFISNRSGSGPLGVRFGALAFPIALSGFFFIFSTSMNDDVLPDVLRVLNSAFSSDKLFPPDESIPTSQESQQLLLNRIALESSVRKQIDDLIRGWISDERGFLLDNSSTSNLVRDRFVEAKHFAEFLIDNRFHVSADHTRESLLQFLLIKYWAVHGVLRLRERLRSFGL